MKIFKRILDLSDDLTKKSFIKNIIFTIIEAIMIAIYFVTIVPIIYIMFDDVPESMINQLFLWCNIMACMLVIFAILRYLVLHSSYKISINLMHSIFYKVGKHLINIPMGWFSESRTGVMTSLLGSNIVDFSTAPAFLIKKIIYVFTVPLVIIALMAIFNWKLAIISLITMPFIYIAFNIIQRNMQNTNKQVQQAHIESNKRLLEFAEYQQTLRAFSSDNMEYNKLYDALLHANNITRKHIKSVVINRLAYAVVIHIAFMIILLSSIHLAMIGDIAGPMLIALLILVMRYHETIISVADMAHIIGHQENAINVIDNILSIQPLNLPSNAKEINKFDISFQNVSFAYQKVNAINNISFDISEKSITAIIGFSGSGKTTILRLIARFWDAQSGIIKIGGIHIHNIYDLMRNISIVFQDVYLFEGTIEENIVYGNNNATSADIDHAITLSGLQEVIAKYGKDRIINQNSANLSGGEAQRISIARAILKNAPIILFDEMTSALDIDNANSMQNIFELLKKDKTIIVITHQLDTIKNADKIIMMENGNIIECGTPDNMGENYQRFIDARLHNEFV